MAKTFPITNVIFDVDGTLLDTESIYTEVTGSITSRYGKSFTWDVKKLMMGRTPIEAAKILVEKLQLPITGHDYLQEEKKVIYELWPTAKDLPGAIKIVDFFKNHKKIKKIAVATSSLNETFKLKSSRHPWFNQFDEIITGDMVSKSKPEPDIFLEAAKRISISEPKKTLVFEDSLNGVLAGKRAGMFVIAIPHPQEEDLESFKKEADVVLENLEHFFEIKHQFEL